MGSCWLRHVKVASSSSFVVEVRYAIADDALELVRLQQIMLVAIDGLDPTRDDWQPAALSRRKEISYPFGSIVEPVTCDDVNFSALVVPFRRLRALHSRLTDTDDSLVAFVVDAPDSPGRLAACAIGLVERRLIGPNNPTGEIGYIVNVVTNPSHRRRGYARACMETLLRWYQRRGIVRIHLRASAEGEPLYQALGFTYPPLPTMQLTMPPPDLAGDPPLNAVGARAQALQRRHPSGALDYRNLGRAAVLPKPRELL
jgi:GNAT superfamily N-acetyltransferase